MPGFKLYKKLVEVSYGLSRNMTHSFKHVSFICDGNKIECIGMNQPFKTHPLAYRYGHRYNSIHSELDALLSFPYAIKNINHYTLYNVRIKNNGSIGLSMPCKKCQNMLSDFSVRNVFYTTGNELEFRRM